MCYKNSPLERESMTKTMHEKEKKIMKRCAITKKKCFRWDDEKTTLFCNSCPVAEAKERYDELVNKRGECNGNME